MHIVRTVSEWQSWCEEARRQGKSVGLVPTMGALHAGHMALVKRAATENDVVVLTIFVNPTQFTNAEDLAKYPRSETEDISLAEKAGVDLLVIPSVEEVWPEFPPTVDYEVGELGNRLEGASRPGHFNGVAQVVKRLFAVIGECTAYFGEKDYQQVAVVRAMVRDLEIPVRIVPVETVREPSGLALSSRNVRLSEVGREKALTFWAALQASQTKLLSVSEMEEHVREIFDSMNVELSYGVVVDNDTLEELDDHYAGPARLLLAGVVDGVRLLDNGPVVVRSGDAVSN